MQVCRISRTTNIVLRYHHAVTPICVLPLQWRHNGLDGVSNHHPQHCLVSRLFGRRWKKILKLRVTGLCVGKSPGTGEFPAQMASNAEIVSIWWRHHVIVKQPGSVIWHRHAVYCEPQQVQMTAKLIISSIWKIPLRSVKGIILLPCFNIFINEIISLLFLSPLALSLLLSSWLSLYNL